MIREIDTRVSRRIDIIDTVIINMFFLFIVIFAYSGLEQNLMNFFMIACVMIGSILGYYSNVTFAILYAILFDFFYASLYIFLNITQSTLVGLNKYFWMVMVPAFTIISAYKGKLIKEIQMENYNLKQENTDLVMIDKETGLRNSQSFFEELQGYININKRYGILVHLMLVKMRYQNEVIKILGKSKYNTIIKLLSKEIDGMLRLEDRKYLLKDDNMFGVIFLTLDNDSELVKERLKNAIKEIKMEENLINRIKIEVIVGLAQYDQNKVNNSFEFFKMAEKDLEYDV